ncbi:hypothetical protein ACWEQ8_27270 [Streptomyces noursei]
MHSTMPEGPPWTDVAFSPLEAAPWPRLSANRAIAAPSNAVTGRKIGKNVADRFDIRLDELRHLDDDLGAADTCVARSTSANPR